MSDLRIRATLCAQQGHMQQAQKQILSLTRGATGYITYDLLNKSYFDFNDITQLDFIFKQNKEIKVFSLYNDDGSLDSEHFLHEEDLVNQKSYDYILLMLSPEETLEFKPTKAGKEVNFEIRLTLGSDVLIEEQSNIIIFDSIIANKANQIE